MRSSDANCHGLCHRPSSCDSIAVLSSSWKQQESFTVTIDEASHRSVGDVDHREDLRDRNVGAQRVVDVPIPRRFLAIGRNDRGRIPRIAGTGNYHRYCCGAMLHRGDDGGWRASRLCTLLSPSLLPLRVNAAVRGASLGPTSVYTAVGCANEAVEEPRRRSTDTTANRAIMLMVSSR